MCPPNRFVKLARSEGRSVLCTTSTSGQLGRDRIADPFQRSPEPSRRRPLKRGLLKVSGVKVVWISSPTISRYPPEDLSSEATTSSRKRPAYLYPFQMELPLACSCC